MDSEYLDSAIERLFEGDLTLFVDAGLSTLCGLPDGINKKFFGEISDIFN